MKPTLLLCYIFYLIIPNVFGQEDYFRLDTNTRHNHHIHPNNFIERYEDKNTHKLKIDNKEIQLTTHNRQSPNERQLDLIKNALTEDFLVNDDMIGDCDQRIPVIAMNLTGYFVIVWLDNRNYFGDIYFQYFDSSGTRIGENTKVNDDLGNAIQSNPSVAIDKAGNFVIVWDDKRNGNFDIFYQRYNSMGIPQGLNIKANDDAGSTNQDNPSISMDGIGNFVIVWADKRNGNSDIYYQRYNSNGTPQGVNKRVNDDAGIATQYDPILIMDVQGNFIFTWEDNRNGNYDIYFQRYNYEGTPQGANIKVNDDVGISNQYYPSIAIDVVNNFVIAWQDERDGNYDIYYQRYNSFGIAQGVNSIANNNSGMVNQRLPAVSMDRHGNFIIAWEDYRNGKSDIYLQRFDSAGGSLGENIRVNDDTNNVSQYSPSIGMDSLGNFIIVWHDYRNSSFYSDIFSQRFNLEGIKEGMNMKVNDDIGAANQREPAIAADQHGNFVIVWEDYRNENSDIYFQRYNKTGTKLGVNVRVNDDAGSAFQWQPSIAMDRMGNFVIVWKDNRNIYSDIYCQRYDKSGVKIGVNFQVNDDAGTALQSNPTVAMDELGNFVIVWEDYRGSSIDIYYQRFNSIGTPIGENKKVNDDFGQTNQRNPTIAADQYGNFVIVWEDYRNILSNIYFQLFDSLGTAIEENKNANDNVNTTYQWYPSIAKSNQGDFVIVWEDYRNDNSDIYYQRFNSQGTKVGANTKANDDEGTTSQYYPSIAMDEAANFIIAWVDNRFDNSDMIGQRYFSEGSANGSNYIIVSAENHSITSPVVTANDTTIIFAWMDNRRSLGWDIYGKIVAWNWNGVVPIELTKLNAILSGKVVQLFWATSTERNNRGFEIERKTENSDWRIIGFREGKGTTTEPQEYSFIDDLFEINGTKLSYRLKHIDYDGTFSYSNIVVVELNPSNFSLSQNYPNPFNPSTTIRYAIPLLGGAKSQSASGGGGLVTLKVYDILGNEIATLVDGYKPAGNYEVEFSTRYGHASGVYFYQLKAGDFIETKKMILLR